MWRLRPNDVEIKLLASTRNLLMRLEEETDHNSGWINNGGLFISHSDERLNEYKRLATLGKCFGIESHILTPEEAQEVFPLLDPAGFTGALYSPGDGVVDPAMMCTALTKASVANGGMIVEDCSVSEIVTGENLLGVRDVRGVVTNKGMLRTNTVVNAMGVWGRDLIEPLGIHLPLIPMKHAYVVSETMDGINQMMPNIRDHDSSIYFRIQGKSICMGGYENNPILLDRVPGDFHFGLYDLDYSVFDTHIQGAVKICPEFGKAGIKSTICGPESFTPDHKPLMGPDPIINGLFHNCGFNSAGMMLGAGCAEQLAKWIIHDRPDLHMFAYDIRRFSPKQKKALNWATERSHEAYAKNYSIVFPHDEALAGRNFTVDPFHKVSQGQLCFYTDDNFTLLRFTANDPARCRDGGTARLGTSRILPAGGHRCGTTVRLVRLLRLPEEHQHKLRGSAAKGLHVWLSRASRSGKSFSPLTTK